MRKTRIIPDELAAFLESGLSIVVATRDGSLQPDGAAACAIRVHDDGTALTAYFYVDAAKRMLRNLKTHPEIALDCDLPTTHRACQVKGVYVSSRRARESERAEIDRQLDAFAADLEGIGIPKGMLNGWRTWPCTAVDVRVTELFEQTPGPGTGERLAGDAGEPPSGNGDRRTGEGTRPARARVRRTGAAEPTTRTPKRRARTGKRPK